jgi:MFS family permease
VTCPSTCAETERDRRLLPVLIWAALTVSVISSLGAPIVPTVVKEQGVPIETAQWLLTVTLLVGVVATPVLGRLGDGRHSRNVLAAALGIVAAGSVLAATAHGFAQLLAGRALQGVGQGALPMVIAVAREHMGPRRLPSAIALLSVTAPVGVGLGFPITGGITEAVGYHAAFWLAGAITVGSAIAVLRVVPARPAGPMDRLDVPGATLLGLGMLSLLLAVTYGVSWGWGSPGVLALLGATPALLGWWVLAESRATRPLVELHLLARRAVVNANLGAVLIGFVMYGNVALLTLLSQAPEGSGLGTTALVSGLLLLPLSVASFLASRVLRMLERRMDPGLAIPFGAACVGITGLVLAAHHDHLWQLFVATGFMGLGIGCTFAAMPALIVASVPAAETGSAMGINQVLRVLGGSLGSAACATILAASTPAGRSVADASGYTTAIVVLACVALLACVACLVVGRMGSPAGSRVAAGDPPVVASAIAAVDQESRR